MAKRDKVENFNPNILKGDLLTIREASVLASARLNKDVTSSNIAYLVQYGVLEKVVRGMQTFVKEADLIAYYDSLRSLKQNTWKKKFGAGVHWKLSFDNLKEAETTKHVHRLHPYKGKFIPQLVEYFIDEHIDAFKPQIYFRPGDIILDPFCGSGTTLIQSNELGIHAIGIDVSAFNALISNVKVQEHNLANSANVFNRITRQLRDVVSRSGIMAFDEVLKTRLGDFNTKHFPSPAYKRSLRLGNINGDAFGAQMLSEFLPVYRQLVKKYGIVIEQPTQDTFMDKWYIRPIRHEIDLLYNTITKIKDEDTKRVLSIVLSRTIRSCRATTHADLSTLKEPIKEVYYCAKHGKLCKPLFSVLRWWNYYGKDTIRRLQQFNKLRTSTYQYCLQGDSRTMDVIGGIQKINTKLAALVKQQKIKGIFTSPPYVGLIDYHEQHAYAYDLFNLERKDALEIGPLSNGQGKEARDSYVKGISAVLNNCKQFLSEDYDVFLVANDKFGLYPAIAAGAGMQILKAYKRPVLNRAERDNGAYAESIFHLKSV